MMNRSMMSIVNLSNSIIGVSILAMPLCFKQCGIILALFIVLFSALLNHFSCYLLLKSAIINRRRNYELLAYDVFGSSGKTLVEVCILLFLLGTCVAFFVIVGDIAPSLISHIFDLDQGPHLRAMVMTALAMFVILPLGFLRNVENLTSFSMMSLLVYLFLALRMFLLSFDKIFDQPPTVNIMNAMNYWNSSYMITYLPIFSMALSCQSQLFEIFNSDLFQTKTGSLKSIMRSIKRAIIICSIVYIVIGSFGYIAFYDINFSGNILQNLPSGFATKLTLLLFLITILTSFPLCLFPSRTSLHSLLFRKGAHSDFLSTAHSIHMSDYHFKLLTIVLIITTMSISIIFPRVELILALVGSTIGATICFIIPALIFIKICDKNTTEYLLSYLLLFFGTAILVFCTMSALHNISVARDNEIEEKINEYQKFRQKQSTQQFVVPVKINQNIQHRLQHKSQNDMKSRINNINKLKQSIQIDMNKLKKQEEILKRLEKQQQEQSRMLSEQQKILNELKNRDSILQDSNKLHSNITFSAKVNNLTSKIQPIKSNLNEQGTVFKSIAPLPIVHGVNSSSKNIIEQNNKKASGPGSASSKFISSKNLSTYSEVIQQPKHGPNIQPPPEVISSYNNSNLRILPPLPSNNSWTNNKPIPQSSSKNNSDKFIGPIQPKGPPSVLKHSTIISKTSDDTGRKQI